MLFALKQFNRARKVLATNGRWHTIAGLALGVIVASVAYLQIPSIVFPGMLWVLVVGLMTGLAVVWSGLRPSIKDQIICWLYRLAAPFCIISGVLMIYALSQGPVLRLSGFRSPVSSVDFSCCKLSPNSWVFKVYAPLNESNWPRTSQISPLRALYFRYNEWWTTRSKSEIEP